MSVAYTLTSTSPVKGALHNKGEVNKKSNTGKAQKQVPLTEERVREIVREEMANYIAERAKRNLRLMAGD